ncbi:palmitoyltransferase ZDHHC23-A-like isoform X1 [Salvelinus fontinalis]|uniref:palmitoyltransferase ZDHHC23-A-like isoform X1 n=1 Tax=Salvelinus fontinalis TaxID=8038 RepID=UPI00248530AA|nr:palmitoyltransferase ZDHHC23-A-like isoform X1 [Salvelinus fontinalis]XP_055799424.1 palmitoyltransferase ZDHHC23-A-like isoform X1 [Salvelinus fontinalis]XP_055799425.1 palmitoyltransferase ZDHHC23-A-like isoform X1 [Salvelinus fontinalis]XP_055799426.1 palmitoyltransferase ZDHHC23-A-like isoform X1 [Salvelinus fontinalis]
MKWEKFKPPEPDDPMCCCECDVDPHGCCCDCDDLDEACSRWLKGEPQKPDCVLPVFGAVMDRLRVRLLPGDRRVEISMVPALVLLPLLLRLAALHFLLGLVILTALPGLVLWYYYATHRKKGRTLFFLSLALFSLAYMYFLFVTEILPRGDVSHLQLVTVTTGVVLTLISLVRTKRGPGFVQPSLADIHSTNQSQLPDKHSASQNGVDQSMMPASLAKPVEQQTQSLTEKGGTCPLCKVVRPPRAGHCRICGGCVQRLDHHCIWINSCVGKANHRNFLLTLLLFLLTSLYGISLVLRSVCPRQNLLTALLYCPGVYNQYSSALCFTCAWYSSIVTGGLLHLLLLQMINISYNLTEREAQLALRKKNGQSRVRGLVVDTGVYSRGFWQNWAEFLTMGEPADRQPSALTDLV